MAFSPRSVLSFAIFMLSNSLDILALFLSASETFPEKVLTNKKKITYYAVSRYAAILNSGYHICNADKK